MKISSDVQCSPWPSKQSFRFLEHEPPTLIDLLSRYDGVKSALELLIFFLQQFRFSLPSLDTKYVFGRREILCMNIYCNFFFRIRHWSVIHWCWLLQCKCSSCLSASIQSGAYKSDQVKTDSEMNGEEKNFKTGNVEKRIFNEKSGADEIRVDCEWKKTWMQTKRLQKENLRNLMSAVRVRSMCFFFFFFSFAWASDSCSDQPCQVAVVRCAFILFHSS